MTERAMPHIQPVKPEWLDGYGHMGMAFYTAAFDTAGWPWAERFGVGPEYLHRTGCGLYTAEAHVRYLKEVRAGTVLEIEVFVIDTEPKRNWIGMVMRAEGTERATLEFVDIHFDTRAGRTVPMPPSIQEALRRAKIAEIPVWAGRGISFQRPKT